MKIDVTQPLLDLNGEELLITSQPCPMCGKPMGDDGGRTLRSACELALSADYQSEQRGGGVTGEVKFQRHCLAIKIHNNDAVQLLAKEIVMLKHVLGLRFPPEIMGPAWLLLEPLDLDDKE